MYAIVYRSVRFGLNHTHPPPFSGTFAVVSLMVGNAISRLAESRSDIMFACQVEQSMPILCNSSSNALNASCCSYEECQDKCVDFSSGIAITIAFTTGILLVSNSYTYVRTYIYSYTDRYTLVTLLHL